jgi:threonyl-tRNA synthetase
MIHRALLGSLERLFGVLIEHFGGAFPAWLAPVQAVMLPITDDQTDYADGVAKMLFARGFRVDIDRSNERLQKKIRNQQLRKVPYMLVAGKSGVADGTVNVRSRNGDQRTMRAEEFADMLAAQVASRA